MKTIDGDVRRFAWSRGQAVWRMAMPIPGVLEDARGAHAEGQLGLLRHSSRNLGLSCAVALALVLEQARPIPAARAQAAWALERIAGNELAADCELLIRGEAALNADELIARCEALAAGVEALIGSAPSPMTAEGYFPSMARAREWLQLADTVGEESFLPAEFVEVL